jgi:hypothetical protein
MPRDGSGVYSLPAGTDDFQPNTVISSSTVDTLTADLKSAFNTAWPVSLGGTGGTSTTPWLVPVGTVSLPGIAFTGDPDTGIYRIGANNLGISANGAKVVDIGTTGVAVTGALSATNNISGLQLIASTFSATGATAGTVVSSSGRINQSVTATTASTQIALYNPNGQVGLLSTSGNDFSVTGSGTGGMLFLGGTTDVRVSGTAGTNAASVVTVGATQTLTNKTLTSPVISSISNTGTLTLPTSTDTLVGRATTDTLTNKTLTSPVMTTPTLGVATATSINFGGTTPLSTYESAGTFTPTITFATPGNLSVAYTVQNGTYTRIGNKVFYTVHVAGTVTYTTASGNIRFAGLPFTVASAESVGTLVMSGWTETATNFQVSAAEAVNATTYLQPVTVGSGTSLSGLTQAQVTTGKVVNAYISGHYTA